MDSDIPGLSGVLSVNIVNQLKVDKGVDYEVKLRKGYAEAVASYQDHSYSVDKGTFLYIDAM